MMCVVAKSFLCTYLLGVFQGGYDNTFRASYKFTTLAAWLSHVKIMAGLTSPVCSNLLEFLAVEPPTSKSVTGTLFTLSCSKLTSREVREESVYTCDKSAENISS